MVPGGPQHARRRLRRGRAGSKLAQLLGERRRTRITALRVQPQALLAVPQRRRVVSRVVGASRSRQPFLCRLPVRLRADGG
eukprot:scaffold126965_cov48-Phaeocystis_antarctica.AAC.3